MSEFPSETFAKESSAYSLDRFVEEGASGNCMSSDTPCGSIKQAIDSLPGSGVIGITEGIYYESGIIINKSLSIFGGFDKTFSSRNPDAYKTIIDAERNDRVITVNSTVDTIDGLHLTGGKIINAIDLPAGGGIFVNANIANFTNNKIYNNESGNGGGIAVSANIDNFSRNIIQDNIATIEGDNIFLTSNGKIIGENNIILQYSIYSSGFDTIVSSQSTFSIFNSILYTPNFLFQGITVKDGAFAKVTNSLVYGYINSIVNFSELNSEIINCWYDGEIVGTLKLINCAKGTNPKLVSPINQDFHLLPDSPLIDSGTNTGAPNRDFDGNIRPLDGNCDSSKISDIGPYEYIKSCDPSTLNIILNRLSGDKTFLTSYEFTGSVLSNYPITSVKYSYDSQNWFETTRSGTDFSFQLTGMTLGDHTVQVKAEDLRKSETITYSFKVVKEEESHLAINLNVLPNNKTTKTNYTFYGNVSSNYTIEYVKYSYDNGLLTSLGIDGVSFSFSLQNMSVGQHSIYIEAKDTKLTRDLVYNFSVVKNQTGEQILVPVVPSPGTILIIDDIEVLSKSSLVFDNYELYIEENTPFVVSGNTTTEPSYPLTVNLNIDSKSQTSSVLQEELLLNEAGHFSFDIEGLKIGEYSVIISATDSKNNNQNIDIKAYIQSKTQIENKKDKVEENINEEKSDNVNRSTNKKTIILASIVLCSTLILGLSITAVIIYEKLQKRGKIKSPFQKKKHYFKQAQ